MTTKHKHDWQDHARRADGVLEVFCAGCGEKDERKMSDEELAELKAWQADMKRIDEEGSGRVE